MKLSIPKILKFNKMINREIKYFFTDVDGTLTDGSTYYSKEGEELKKFSHIDGTGFYLLNQVGIIPGIITGENSEIVLRRAEKLGIQYCFLGINNKVEYLEKFLNSKGLTFNNLAYIGDDLNDLDLLCKVKFSFAPNDAREIIKKNVSYVCESIGGQGAFRESVERLFKEFKIDIYQTFKTKPLDYKS